MSRARKPRRLLLLRMVRDARPAASVFVTLLAADADQHKPHVWDRFVQIGYRFNGSIQSTMSAATSNVRDNERILVAGVRRRGRILPKALIAEEKTR